MEKILFSSLLANLDEIGYRSFDGISYSKLSSFVKDGPRSLIDRDVKSTDSLRFGSLLDTLLTAPEELNSKFIISVIETPSDQIKNILQLIWKQAPSKTASLSELSPAFIKSILDQVNYYKNWKDTTRIQKIVDDGQDYYNLMKLGMDKIIISQADYDIAMSCATVLKSNPATTSYFVKNIFDDDIELLHQAILITNYPLNNTRNKTVKAMFDMVKIDHKNKIIYSKDLKTTSDSVEEFESNFLKWRYDIQAELYTYILKQICKENEYFKDFTIAPFGFIVINKSTQQVIVWNVSDKTWDNLKKKNYKSISSLIPEVLWHYENGVFDYSKATYENKFERTIDLKFFD